jgi:DNA repair exonuclease SbcCD ATPase subunit
VSSRSRTLKIYGHILELRMVLHIFHLSDIHIRNERQNEYNIVFERALAAMTMIKTALADEEFLIVITGDIFHSKVVFDGSDVPAFNKLLHGLKKIAPVVIIAGNHDTNMNDPEGGDLISQILDNPDIPTDDRVTYLRRSGVHQYGADIDFGVISVLDKRPVRDIVDECSFRPGVRKIGLFHRQINNKSRDTADLSRFIEMFDIVLAGDLHERQKFGSRQHGMYAGPLFQQSINEDYRAGFIWWNLSPRIPNDATFTSFRANTNGFHQQFIYVKNDYGRITFNLGDDGSWPEMSDLPPIIERARVNLGNSYIPAHELAAIIREKYPQCQEVRHVYTTSIKVANDDQHQRPPVAHVNIEDEIRRFAVGMNVEDLLALHRRLLQSTGDESRLGGRAWSLQRLEWNNMVCYGKDNILDMTQYNKGAIIGVLAENRMGKTSIIDLLCLVLFNNTDRISKSQSLGSVRAYVMTSGGRSIVIEQTMQNTKDVRHVLYIDGQLYTGATIAATYKYLEQYLGTYDEFIQINVIKQGGTKTAERLIYGTPSERQETVYNMFGLNELRGLYDKAYEEFKIIKDRYRATIGCPSIAAGAMKEHAERIISSLGASTRVVEELEALVVRDARRISDIEARIRVAQLEHHKLGTSMPPKPPIEVMVLMEVPSLGYVPERLADVKYDISFEDAQNELAALGVIEDASWIENQLREITTDPDLSRAAKYVRDDVEPMTSDATLWYLIDEIERLKDYDNTYSGEKLDSNAILQELKRTDGLGLDFFEPLDCGDKSMSELMRFFNEGRRYTTAQIEEAERQLSGMRKDDEIVKDIENTQLAIKDLTERVRLDKIALKHMKRPQNEWLDVLKGLQFDDGACSCCNTNRMLVAGCKDDINAYVNSIDRYDAELAEVTRRIENFDSAMEELQKRSHELVEEYEEFRRLSDIVSRREFNRIGGQLRAAVERDTKRLGAYKHRMLRELKYVYEIEIKKMNKRTELTGRLEKAIRALVLQSIVKNSPQKVAESMAYWSAVDNNAAYEQTIARRQAEDEFNRVMRQIEALSGELSEITRGYNVNNVRLYQLKEEMGRLAKQRCAIEEYAHTSKVYEDYIECMDIKKNGIPTIVAGRYLEVMTSEMNVMLAQCQSGLKLRAAGNFEILIEGARDIPVRAGSGFEVFIVSMVMRIAMMKFCTKNIGNFMILDEVATACDKGNLERFKTFIQEISGQFDFIVIISHMEQMKQVISDAVYITRRADGGSHINNTGAEYAYKALDPGRGELSKLITPSADSKKFIKLNDAFTFNERSEKYTCTLCNREFTQKGRGGHMSRSHPEYK